MVNIYPVQLKLQKILSGFYLKIYEYMYVWAYVNLYLNNCSDSHSEL